MLYAVWKQKLIYIKGI